MNVPQSKKLKRLRSGSRNSNWILFSSTYVLDVKKYSLWRFNFSFGARNVVKIFFPLWSRSFNLFIFYYKVKNLAVHSTRYCRSFNSFVYVYTLHTIIRVWNVEFLLYCFNELSKDTHWQGLPRSCFRAMGYLLYTIRRFTRKKIYTIQHL